MIKNGGARDRNGELVEERMPFMESSDLVDDHSLDLLEESSEAHVLCANKQKVITIDSTSDNCTTESYLGSSDCETAWTDSGHTNEPLLDSGTSQASAGLSYAWDEESWQTDGGNSTSETSDRADREHGGNEMYDYDDSDSAYQELYNDAHIFIHDELSPVYDEPSDPEVVRVADMPHHGTDDGVSHPGAAGDIAHPEMVNEAAREDDTDIVVVESRDLSEAYPRISHEILSAVLCKVYLAYYSLILVDTADSGYFLSNLGFNLGGRNLSSALRDFSHDEIEYLKSKVRRILANDINSHQIIDTLVALIDPNKIDGVVCRNELKAVKFKNMIDRSTTSCVICYESFRPDSMCTSLKCMHTFHSKCVRCWVRQNWCCPLCRCKDI